MMDKVCDESLEGERVAQEGENIQEVDTLRGRHQLSIAEPVDENMPALGSPGIERAELASSPRRTSLGRIEPEA